MNYTIYNTCYIICYSLCCKDIPTCYHFACGLHYPRARVEEYCRLVATDSSKLSAVQ